MLTYILFCLPQFAGTIPGTTANSETHHTSPQAVFTSFKLPKPGSGASPSQLQLPSTTTTTTVAAEPPLLPVRYGSSPNPPTSPQLPSTPPASKMSAPLGGLPGMVSQLDTSDKMDATSPAKMDQDDNSPRNLAGGLIKAKAKGTYYPLTAFPTNMPQGPVMHQPETGKEDKRPQGKKGSFI